MSQQPCSVHFHSPCAVFDESPSPCLSKCRDGGSRFWPSRTFRADSPVFKDRRMILLEFSSVNLPRSVRNVRPIKSIGYTVRHCQSGTFDVDCTGGRLVVQFAPIVAFKI